MSEAEAPLEAEERAEASKEGDDETPEEGEQPAVDDDEMAALDAVREEVAAESAPSESNDNEANDGGEQTESGAKSGELVDSSDTAGDFYVGTLVSVSNMVIEEHGRAGAEEIDGAMLRQMGVDDAVDELLADDGAPDMPPEQQVLLGTTVFGLAMLATKTTVLDQALENADLDL